MRRYVGIDSGKMATKVAEYLPKLRAVRKFSIKTKASEGDFRDDAIEEQTVVIEVDGEVYKIGNGARGAEATLETTKRSDAHRLCTLTALAYLASPKGEDEFCVAVGLPAKEWSVVSKRMDYKDYILPQSSVEVSIKATSSSPVIKKKFRVSERFVFPESIGALFSDEIINTITKSSIIGVVDLGNLNLNATFFQGTELNQDLSLTAELGGAILIQELAQELSANVATCDDFIVSSILFDSNERSLPGDGNLSPEQIEASKEVFARVLKQHAEKVKRACRARGWSLDVMRIAAIGGTSKLLAKELKESFGGCITVLESPEYCNALGYLRMMCARLPEIGEVIPIDVDYKQAKEKEEEA